MMKSTVLKSSKPHSASSSSSSTTKASPGPVLAPDVRVAILTAVHNDLEAKERRQRNIIITGFKTAGDDKTAVSELLLYNL